jgi:hypothetical protein
MGDVFLNCPLSDDVFWFDWCSHEDFAKRYGNYDKGRFFWVSA